MSSTKTPADIHIPAHVAIIMDGNGRWALQHGNSERIFGHRNAIKAVRETIETSARIGIKYLTLYTFSTENWQRPKAEVDGLMDLLTYTIGEELDSLVKNNIRLNISGDMKIFRPDLKQKLIESINATKHCNGMTLNLALNYSGRWEIIDTVFRIAEKVSKGDIRPGDINENLFSEYICNNIPDPDLMIRTGGDYRISNFLLWQLAYTELYFTPVLWPDFSKEHLMEAINDFNRRERRFGKTSDQITHNN